VPLNANNDTTRAHSARRTSPTLRPVEYPSPVREYRRRRSRLTTIMRRSFSTAPHSSVATAALLLLLASFTTTVSATTRAEAEGRGGGAAPAAAAAAVNPVAGNPGVATDADTTSAVWPEGMPGLWTGHIVKSTVPLTPTEKLSGVAPGALHSSASQLNLRLRCH